MIAINNSSAKFSRLARGISFYEVRVAVLALVLVAVSFGAFAQKRETFLLGQPIAVGNIFVCKSLDDAKAILDAIAANDEDKFKEVAVPLQTSNKCGIGLSRGGVVIYQMLAYKRDGTAFRVYSLIADGIDGTWYEITDWVHIGNEA